MEATHRLPSWAARPAAQPESQLLARSRDEADWPVL